MTSQVADAVPYHNRNPNNDRQDFQPPTEAERTLDTGQRNNNPNSENLQNEFTEFVLKLHENIGNLETLIHLYSHDAVHIAETVFKFNPLPQQHEVEVVLVRNRKGDFGLTLYLYQELYNRFMFTRRDKSVCLGERLDSYVFYQDLLMTLEKEFSKVLHKKKCLALPVEWTWDLLDSFTSQSVGWQKWRFQVASVLTEKSDANSSNHVYELMWDQDEVTKLLLMLFNSSRICSLLTDPKPPAVTSESFQQHPINIHVGFFSIVCLIRIYVMSTDYQNAVDLAELIETSEFRDFLWTVPVCAVSYHYYIGFAYMMLRHYKCAIRILSSILKFSQENSSQPFSSWGYQREFCSKYLDKCSRLLILCSTFSGLPLEQSLALKLDSFTEKIVRLQGDDESVYAETFNKAAPKFISLCKLRESYSLNVDLIEEVRYRQINVFMQEIRNHRRMCRVPSFVKLYHNISLKKLKDLMYRESDEEISSETVDEALKSEILYAMHRQRSITENNQLDNLTATDNKSNPTVLNTEQDGAAAPTGMIEFYLEGDVLHVKDRKASKDFASEFLNQINETQILMTKI